MSDNYFKVSVDVLKEDIEVYDEMLHTLQSNEKFRNDVSIISKIDRKSGINLVSLSDLKDK